MERMIAEKLADEVIKHIDLAAFAKEFAPTLLKAVETQMIESVKEIEWGDFIYELIGTEAVGKELTKRIVAALKNVS